MTTQHTAACEAADVASSRTAECACGSRDNDTPPLTQVRHIPECSVVRFPDGRMGWLEAGKRVVWLGGRRGKKVLPSTELEIIHTPDELAAEYIKGLI